MHKGGVEKVCHGARMPQKRETFAIQRGCLNGVSQISDAHFSLFQRQIVQMLLTAVKHWLP
jgi:hypothetical protein